MSLLAILHLLAALACGIHAVRSGQPIVLGGIFNG